MMPDGPNDRGRTTSRDRTEALLSEVFESDVCAQKGRGPEFTAILLAATRARPGRMEWCATVLEVLPQSCAFGALALVVATGWGEARSALVEVVPPGSVGIPGIADLALIGILLVLTLPWARALDYRL